MNLSIVWVAVGFGLIFVHQIDDAFVHPESNGIASLLVTVVIASLIMAFYRRMPRLLRVALLGLLGLNAIVQGVAGHLVHIFEGHAAGSDWTGIAFVAGGLVLLADAARGLARTTGQAG